MSDIQMLHLVIPDTNDRELRMNRYTKSGKIHLLLLDHSAPPCLANLRMNSEIPKPVVETL